MWSVVVSFSDVATTNFSERLPSFIQFVVLISWYTSDHAKIPCLPTLRPSDTTFSSAMHADANMGAAQGDRTQPKAASSARRRGT